MLKKYCGLDNAIDMKILFLELPNLGKKEEMYVYYS